MPSLARRVRIPTTPCDRAERARMPQARVTSASTWSATTHGPRQRVGLVSSRPLRRRGTSPKRKRGLRRFMWRRGACPRWRIGLVSYQPLRPRDTSPKRKRGLRRFMWRHDSCPRWRVGLVSFRPLRPRGRRSRTGISSGGVQREVSKNAFVVDPRHEILRTLDSRPRRLVAVRLR